ncbi:MAG: hypothetical protein F6K22_21810 [Okeania sp. SIO2F4]|uniref:hypothetical protein n=1 Tax=Okeania sp. SIO2F4 TaxID=2607790 RepID=UPI00142A5300|nr:hypothetical protein [Okeania sp. SIO2F4]NES05223.1 hypothetical protein [Okeania sp. SIO2F4]
MFKCSAINAINVGWVERSETQQSFIPNSKKVVTVLISKFPPVDKTTVVIFSEIGIIGVGFRPSTQSTPTKSTEM